MLFTITLIIGGLCAWRLSNQGFIALWAHFFNSLVSIYLGIMSYPTVRNFFPESVQTPWLQFIGTLGVAALVFIITHQLVNLYLAGAFRLETPAIVEKFGTPILGFLVGYTLSGFVLFTTGSLPIVRYGLADTSTVNFSESRQNVLFTCNLVSHLSRQHIDGPENNLRIINALSEGVYFLPTNKKAPSTVNTIPTNQ